VEPSLGRLWFLIECAAYVGLAIALGGMAFIAFTVSAASWCEHSNPLRRAFLLSWRLLRPRQT